MEDLDYLQQCLWGYCINGHELMTLDRKPGEWCVIRELLLLVKFGANNPARYLLYQGDVQPIRVYWAADNGGIKHI